MERLRVWTKKASSPPPRRAAGEESLPPPPSNACPQDRLDHLSEEIYAEEDRHQRAMMTIENSLMGCGSDDWSVDSDYAFHGFSDDDSGTAMSSHDAHASPDSSPFRRSRKRHSARDGSAVENNTGAPGHSNGGAGKSPSFNHSSSEGKSPSSENCGASAKSVGDDVEEARRGVIVTDNSASGAEGGEGDLALSRDEHIKQQGAVCEGRHFGDPGSSTDNVHTLRLEQRMFLKAAFQLLEERDRQAAAMSGSYSLHSNGGGLGLVLPELENVSTAVGLQGRGVGADGSGVRVATGGLGGERARFKKPFLRRRVILKAGTLRKATSRSVGRLETTTWKTKRVELSPGRFAYADGGSVLGKKSTKVIPLHLGFCICRTVRAKDTSPSAKGSMSLPASLNLGARAGSKDGGSRGDSGAGGGVGSEAGGSSNTSGSKHLLEIAVVGSKRRLWAAESKMECRRWVSAIKGAMTERPVDPTETSMEENQMPIIPHDSCYRGHMESYLTARASLRTATSIEAYMEALDSLRAASKASLKSSALCVDNDCEECPLGVPVKWIKQQLPGAERVYQVPTRHRGKSALAQLWKDMKRDTVSINGRVLKGERGPEAIVGALTRCILAQAGRLPANDALSKLSEARSLLAARDVLLACDRTTSGGDTYLVVDNLCRNPDLVVLVPASQEAEPLDIEVTLHPRPHADSPSLFRDNPHGGHIAIERSTSAFPSTTEELINSLSPTSNSSNPSPPQSPIEKHSSPAATSKGHSGRLATKASPQKIQASSAHGGGTVGVASAGEGPAELHNRGARGARGAAGASKPAETKQRGGRLILVGKRRPRLNRSSSTDVGRGSATGGRFARTAPLPTNIAPLESRNNEGTKGHRICASADGVETGNRAHDSTAASVSPIPQSLAATAPASSLDRAFPDPMDDRDIFGSSDARHRDRTFSAGERGGFSRGNGSGGGIFASLARRKSGDVSGREQRSGSHSRAGAGGLRSNKAVPAAVTGARASAQEDFGGSIDAGSRHRHGSEGLAARGGRWDGASSAPVKSASNAVFFGEDTSDGGQGSDSSNEDDGEGSLSRRSCIRVACTARTSYKLFSSDPQDEDRDVYAIVTGLFEQTFTISKEMAFGGLGAGHIPYAGMGSATRTEGSVAFLTFHEPLLKRESIDPGDVGVASVVFATATAELSPTNTETCANTPVAGNGIEFAEDEPPDDTDVHLDNSSGYESAGEEGPKPDAAGGAKSGGAVQIGGGTCEIDGDDTDTSNMFLASGYRGKGEGGGLNEGISVGVEGVSSEIDGMRATSQTDVNATTSLMSGVSMAHDSGAGADNGTLQTPTESNKVGESEVASEQIRSSPSQDKKTEWSELTAVITLPPSFVPNRDGGHRSSGSQDEGGVGLGKRGEGAGGSIAVRNARNSDEHAADYLRLEQLEPDCSEGDCW